MIKFILLFVIFLYDSSLLFSQSNEEKPVISGIAENLPDLKIKNLIENETNRKPKKRRKRKEILIDFSFTDENLINIINLIAEKKDLNIILPQGAQAINQKITFNYPEKISLDKAWEFLLTFLTLSGYSLTVDETGIFSIVKTDPNVSREPMPLFINVSPENIPATEQKIRYVYYLKNIRVPENKDTADPLNTMLKDILTPEGIFLYDPRSNAVIISDNANNIASAMKIVVALDNTGYREAVEVIPLFYTNADTIVKLFKELIPPTQDSRFPLRSGPKTESNLFFTSGTGVFSYGRLNRLILIGKDTAVQRIKEFIAEYIDVAPETGKSILHYINLQYLDADEFAKVLQRIVSIGTGQEQVVKEAAGGPERYFEGVIIQPEAAKPRREAEPVTGTQLAGGPAEAQKGQVYQGGNRLIIAARESDFLRIKELVQKLDKPQPQVILEVLILDITKENDDLIAGTVRNKGGLLDCGNTANFLASHITDVNTVYGGSITTAPPAPQPVTLATDLLAPVATSATLSNILANPNVSAGSLIFAFNDNNGSGIWGLLQILKENLNTKVLSHPFFVTTNNQKASVESVTIRRATGNAEGTPTGGTITIKQVDVPASIQVTVLPRISSLDRLNLKIDINIDEYESANPTNFTRRTRSVTTNANLGSGNVLAIGGLMQDTEQEVRTQTPILGQIPIIGWLFSKTETAVVKNNLVVFICPTIVDPKLRKGMDRYTTDKIRSSDKDLDNSDILNNNRDPITHLFFNNGQDRDIINGYLNDAKNSEIKPKHFREDIRKTTGSRQAKRSEFGCTVKEEKIIPEPPLIAKRKPAAIPVKERVKELIAMEDDPFSSIKQMKS
ncbi:hypothetical protein M1446_00705 [Candidatus Dependentiae bacterium]|nr:hypothetical protein [Candidatus Dependentiae bacterium]